SDDWKMKPRRLHSATRRSISAEPVGVPIPPFFPMVPRRRNQRGRPRRGQIAASKPSHLTLSTGLPNPVTGARTVKRRSTPGDARAGKREARAPAVERARSSSRPLLLGAAAVVAGLVGVLGFRALHDRAATTGPLAAPGPTPAGMHWIPGGEFTM